MTAQFAPSVAKLKSKIEARVEEIKANLTAYIDRDMHISDGVPVSIALLELALDRYIDVHGKQDAQRLLVSAFLRAVEKSKKRLN